MGDAGQARCVASGVFPWMRSEAEDPDEEADEAPVVTASPKGVVALPAPDEAAAAAATTAATDERFPVDPAAANERE